MRVGIIGRGTVGRAVEALFAQKAEVIAWDIADESPYPADELATCAFRHPTQDLQS